MSRCSKVYFGCTASNLYLATRPLHLCTSTYWVECCKGLLFCDWRQSLKFSHNLLYFLPLKTINSCSILPDNVTIFTLVAWLLVPIGVLTGFTWHLVFPLCFWGSWQKNGGLVQAQNKNIVAFFFKSVLSLPIILSILLKII